MSSKKVATSRADAVAFAAWRLWTISSSTSTSCCSRVSPRCPLQRREREYHAGERRRGELSHVDQSDRSPSAAPAERNESLRAQATHDAGCHLRLTDLRQP